MSTRKEASVCTTVIHLVANVPVDKFANKKRVEPKVSCGAAVINCVNKS